MFNQVKFHWMHKIIIIIIYKIKLYLCNINLKHFLSLGHTILIISFTARYLEASLQ